MSKIKVSYFPKRKDKEIYGLINALPFGFSGILTMISISQTGWSLFSIICSVLFILSYLSLIFFRIYNNCELEIDTLGLTVLKSEETKLLKWNEIINIKFYQKENESFNPSIILKVITTENEIIEIILDKFLFVMPQSKYLLIKDQIESISNGKFDLLIHSEDEHN